MLEMTNGVIKLLLSVFCLQTYPSQARHVLLFLGKMFIISVLQNNRTFDILIFHPLHLEGKYNRLACEF